MSRMLALEVSECGARSRGVRSFGGWQLSLAPAGAQVQPSPAGQAEPLSPSDIASVRPHLQQLLTSRCTNVAQDGFGTGFFVGPTHLVTNRHVVEKSKDGSVLLVSRRLSAPQIGVVVHRRQPGRPVDLI